ncbi:MAG: hypothetical protein H6Q00_2757 [Holophagaceae bacterium]|nr:hypothetical protein [Holophagaceae bacterium]
MPAPKARPHPSPASELMRLKPGCDLVASTVEAERASFKRALETKPKKLVLDLTGVSQIDSLGITLILGLYKSCQRLGIPFAVEEAAPEILRLFKLFSIHKLMPVSEASSHE